MSSNAQRNADFLGKANPALVDAVLTNIAATYQITHAEVREELTQDKAEHALDYITGPLRPIAQAVCNSMGLGVN